jgi:integrase
MMGRKSKTGGVTMAGRDRIQFDFMLAGVRYRPTLLRTPTETNLRRAREHLVGIKERIAQGTFFFAEEFPDFLHLNKVPDEGCPRTCAHVFDAFLAHCESRVTKNDMATVTLTSYRKILNSIWRPQIGAKRFLSVLYSTVVKVADDAHWSKKTYNNAISVLRCAFRFGYRDYPDKHNPTYSLRSARIQKKDRTRIDPFKIQEAETLIAAIHRDWGEAQGNYDEFRFFTGMRPSEQIALLVADFDPARGTLNVTKARVAGIDKDSTKTGEDRRMTLCPRALDVLNRQLALRMRLELAGKIDHDHLFFKVTGEPIRSLQYPYRRWRRTLLRNSGIRYRKPYCARHSSVSWDLMVGRNPLWVAKQHGHSITTMLRAYAAWAEGAVEADIEAIQYAMAFNPRAIRRAPTSATSTGNGPQADVRSVARKPSSISETAHHNHLSVDLPAATLWQTVTRGITRILTGGERGTRTLDLGYECRNLVYRPILSITYRVALVANSTTKHNKAALSHAKLTQMPTSGISTRYPH